MADGRLNVKDHRLWESGEHILQQDLWRGQLLVSRPVTVVADRRDLLVLYTHPNAPYCSAAMRGRRYCLSLEERYCMEHRLWSRIYREKSCAKGAIHFFSGCRPNVCQTLRRQVQVSRKCRYCSSRTRLHQLGQVHWRSII